MAAVAWQRDASVWFLFVGLLVMFVAGSTASEVVFSAGLVLATAAVTHIGFSQWTDRAWIPVATMAAVLALGLALVIVLADADVLVSGTVLGFHPATAALVYVIWIPGFFTLGLAFVLIALRREQEERRSHAQGGGDGEGA